MPDSPEKSTRKWQHPSEVMRVHKLRMKKRLLQERISGKSEKLDASNTEKTPIHVILQEKRSNPFSVENKSKKSKPNSPTLTGPLEESTDHTLFKLLNSPITAKVECNYTSFDNILNRINSIETISEDVAIVKKSGEKWFPIDWSLKSKFRLLSTVPFPYTTKLKLSYEASGITGFSRCTDIESNPCINAKFNQCCLYWQHPSLPWLKLFPRNIHKVSDITSIGVHQEIRDSLQNAWFDSFRSVYQLVRTKQCPYFYLCANNFTVLFRAAGICGFSGIHVLITPTTRGFRKLMKGEDIEFQMPLRQKRLSDQGYETMDVNASVDLADSKNTIENGHLEEDEDSWLKSMGLNQDDIKQINYREERVMAQAESQEDGGPESLVLVEGASEVHSVYNFLVNCKSVIPLTGATAGIPPTLLAPVAFRGASVEALKARENKILIDGNHYYSVELTGPVLPTTSPILMSLRNTSQSVTGTTSTIHHTIAFNQITREPSQTQLVFAKENLSDCGLSKSLLEPLCRSDQVSFIDCVKYDGSTDTYSWS